MNIFLSTPISCFTTTEELAGYKQELSKLLMSLRQKHDVCAEIERLESFDSYDPSEKSLGTDMRAIQICDVFIMHYPKSFPTSALIELGAAISEQKTILIIVPSVSLLPYLATGIPAYIDGSFIIESTDIDDICVEKIEKILDDIQ